MVMLLAGARVYCDVCQSVMNLANIWVCAVSLQALNTI